MAGLTERIAASHRIEDELSGKDELRRVLVLALTAMGPGPSVEEQLLRLMAWVGAWHHSEVTHTRLRHPEEILIDRRAWCDQQVKVWIYLVHRFLGIPVREYAMHHCDKVNGHTVAEAFYEGAWHLYDVHSEHQAVYRIPDDELVLGDPDVPPVLSYPELRAHPEIVAAEGHWWRGNDGHGKEGFYLPGSTCECYAYPDGRRVEVLQ